MAVNDGKREDETLVHVLANIDKLNKRGIKPDLDDLKKRVRLTKVHLDMVVSELFKKEYIDSESNVRDYDVTDKGKYVLGRYKLQAQHFADSVMEHYQSDRKDELYKIIIENKDFLWFAYFERMLTKEQIELFAKKLDASIARLWWDKSIQGYGSDYDY